MSQILWMDYETRSTVNLRTCGAFRYVEDPYFAPLLLSWAFDEDDVTVTDFALGDPWPTQFLDALQDPSVVKVAHNAAFERLVTGFCQGEYQPPEMWFDTAVLFAQCGLPRSLDGACDALHLPEDMAKIKEGKALIRYFCVPIKRKGLDGVHFRLPGDDMDKWARFKKYGARDVESMRTAAHILGRRWAPRPEEHRFWCLDARINEKGVRIDRPMVVNAIAMDRKQKAPYLEEARELTGLDNPNSLSQVKDWIQKVEGITVTSLNKDNVPDLRKRLKTPEARHFLDLREEFSKTSTTKYEAMLRGLCNDGTVKGCFLFYGANRTGRFAGRMVQFQNLPKNKMDSLDAARQLVVGGHYSTINLLYDSLADTLKQLIRTAIIPNPGQTVLVSDFAAIEARVIAWLAGEEWRLQVFREGGDIYCASATRMFKVPVVKHGVNGHLRASGKVAELALGYGGGINAMKNVPGGKDLNLTDAELQEIVDQWRAASPKIAAFWKSMEKAAIKAIISKGTAVSQVGNIRFDMEDGVLWMTLPSKRRIAYWGARYAPSTSKFKKGRMTISYMGLSGEEDDKGGRKQGNKWVRLETWGGKLVENCVQATARDCLREAMFNLEDAGFDMRAHVHDEVIVYEPIGGRSVEEMSDLMGRPISWAPGLPLRADGYETPYYKKD